MGVSVEEGLWEYLDVEDKKGVARDASILAPATELK
jgi:hypothetical protein